MNASLLILHFGPFKTLKISSNIEEKTTIKVLKQSYNIKWSVIQCVQMQEDNAKV